MSSCGSTIGIDCKREYIAALRVASINRSQLVLRTVDVERLIEEDHCSRSIWQLIGRMDLGLYTERLVRLPDSAAAITRHRSW